MENRSFAPPRYRGRPRGVEGKRKAKSTKFPGFTKPPLHDIRMMENERYIEFLISFHEIDRPFISELSAQFLKQPENRSFARFRFALVPASIPGNSTKTSGFTKPHLKLYGLKDKHSLKKD